MKRRTASAAIALAALMSVASVRGAQTPVPETETEAMEVFRAEVSETDSDGEKTGGTEYVLYAGGREVVTDFGEEPKETELTNLEYNEVMSVLYDSFLDAEDSPTRGGEPEWTMSLMYGDEVLREYVGGESGSYAVRKIAGILRGKD